MSRMRENANGRARLRTMQARCARRPAGAAGVKAEGEESEAGRRADEPPLAGVERAPPSGGRDCPPEDRDRSRHAP